VHLLHGADRREHRGRREDQRNPLLVVRPGDEREHRDSDSAEHAREEEPARANAVRRRACRLGREPCDRRRAAESDREREHARLEMAVVGDDRPPNGVVAVREPPPEGHDQRPPTLDSRLPAQDRGAAFVANRRDARANPHDVGEDDTDERGRPGEDRAVPGLTPDEGRVPEGDRRRGDRSQEGRRGDEGAPAHFRIHSRSGC